MDLSRKCRTQLYKRQQEIGREVHDVKRLTETFGQHVKLWNTGVETLDRALRDFGDVENFTTVLEQDMHELADLLVKLALDIAVSSEQQAPG